MKILIVPETAARESSFVRPGEIQVVGYKEHLEDISRLMDAQEELLAYDEAKERELFESRWGFTNEEQEIYFIPELNCYGSARVNDAANNKSSAWYWWQACAKSRAGIQS